MTVYISGSGGIQNPLGSAAAPSESNTTNSNTGAYFPTGTTYGIATNGSNAMYIDASQNVGIGTSSPAAKLNVVTSGGKSTIGIGDTAASSYSQLLMFAGAGKYNWSLGAQYNVNNAFEITPSTATGGTTFSTPALVINSSGNVGIGTNSPSSSAIVRYLDIGDATSAGLVLTAVNKFSIYSSSSSSLVFRDDTAATTRMVLDSSGNLLVGTTATSYGGKIRSVFANTSQVGLTLTDTATTYTGNYVVFENSAGATAGTIAHNGATTVNYVASSDYRLKENVKPLVNSLDRVLALNPVSYDWVEDKSYGEGFIAHELQEHIPLAVSGIKDAVNEDGSIKPQGVDYGKLTTVLVAAMQEQQKLIQELSAEVTALKAKVGA